MPDFFVIAWENLQSILAAGGVVVALLMGLSVVALAVVLIKLYDGYQARLGRNKTLERLLTEWDRVEQTGRGTPDLGRGLLPEIATLAFTAKAHSAVSTHSLNEARERVLIEADRILARLDWGSRGLELIAQIAPLLGLFGTVLGMIDAFRALQDAGTAVDPSVLAGGIWVALLTTAVGLALAMPVTACLAYFDGRTESVRRRAETIIEVIFKPGLLQSKPENAKRVHANDP